MKLDIQALIGTGSKSDFVSHPVGLESTGCFHHRFAHENPL